MSLHTMIHTGLHALYFIIAALIGLVGLMPQWTRDMLDINQGFGDVGLFIFIYIFLVLAETIIENTFIRQFEPIKMAKDMLQNLISSFFAVGLFLMAGYVLGNAVKNQILAFILGVLVFVSFEWVCRISMCILIKKLSTPRKRQVIR